MLRIGVDYTAAVRQGAGIGRYTRGIIGALAAQDRESSYRLFVAGRGAQGHTPHAPNVRTRRVPLTDVEAAWLWQDLRLPLPIELLLGPLDVFHSPDFVLPPVWRARTIVTVHDLSFLRVPEHAHPRVLAYLLRSVPRAVRRADLVLAVSECTARDLVELLGVPRERVLVICPGVDAHFRPVEDADTLTAVRRRYGLERPFILGVGTLQPRKNLTGLIEAFARLTAQRSLPHELIIAGREGWLYEPIFARVQALRLHDRVRFLGFVADEDLPALYTLAGCLAYPSFYEGFGLPALEAMACGTPVVASSTSSLPEVAGPAALLVDPHDVDGLAAALDRALHDEQLRAGLCRAGRQRAAQFTWRRAAQQLLAAYRSLASHA
ncbi:MAG TPA: glycosyltransferase family 1 protein [Anaerolineae bacterium]|nr:glycosyltransferase family 1 protein [Anaerolineae bacterium]HOQ98711.1 glycosyltransferase family 1 protein [Anaerolineae bacterium]HPL29604.1 glycosyltransferase family 1 protein [Anaerolineae bacterium]